jgi:hypothetical protein
MKRRTLARGIAALGAACLLLAPFATTARAADTTLPIYQASGVAQGVITTFALVPSIFDPLLEAGTNFTRTQISSQGGGQSGSLAAQVYPGSLVVGFLGCPSPLPGIAQAQYPPGETCKTEARSTFFSLPPSGNDQLSALSQVASVSVSELAAKAKQGTASADITTQKFAVGGSTPLDRQRHLIARRCDKDREPDVDVHRQLRRHERGRQRHLHDDGRYGPGERDTLRSDDRRLRHPRQPTGSLTGAEPRPDRKHRRSTHQARREDQHGGSDQGAGGSER